jgi:hypothetical protein
VPIFRALLLVFGLAIIAAAGLYLIHRDRKYLRWAGRLLGWGLAAAVLFFLVLIVQKFI